MLKLRRPAIYLVLVYLILISCVSAFGQVPFDKAEFAARRAKVFEKIGDGAAIVFANEEHIHAVKYREAPDFYYLTGVEEPSAVLLLVGKSKKAILAAPQKARWKLASEGPGIRDIPDAAKLYGLDRVIALEDLVAWFKASDNRVSRLYAPLTPPDQLEYAREEMTMLETDEIRLPFARISRVKNLVAGLHALQPSAQLVDVNPILDDLRWVKSPYEIVRIRMAGKIGAEGVKEAIKGTKPGMYEYEIEAAARFVYVKRGARGDGFMPIVASGPNTLIFHYNKNNRRMQAGEVVYMDYGADYDYYVSDITRTWPVSDKFTPDQEKMYRCVLEARAAIIAAVKPGAVVEDLQKAGEIVYKKYGFEKEYLSMGRYVGHFVGISVHDVGADDRAFVPGVVFNVEPLLTDEKNKVHVRLEDTILVTATGSENLTADVPVELSDIYALMKQKPIDVVK
ncbi:MAG TPA: Xaa-Pro peptidase family protein [Pyrinomonadaceae bacterium]|nr:Xaa-Pro peptidase family protein [Pyrinomonadaceae bacterium]